MNRRNETEPPGYYRQRDWAGAVQALLVIGEKGPRPPLKDTYRATLEFALKVVRTPRVRPEADTPEWYQQRHQVHSDLAGMVAEARWYGAQFLVGKTAGIDDSVLPQAEPKLRLLILNGSMLRAGPATGCRDTDSSSVL